jgi:16S rRNA C1402 (ribose-2'-O) methylase RsmI
MRPQRSIIRRAPCTSSPRPSATWPTSPCARLHVLQLADTVACEDTRHTQALLRAYGIDKSAHQLLAVHQHNEAEAAQQVVQRLQQGQRVAYVSDAGTPGVSDPGARLAQACARQGCARCRCQEPAASPRP